MEYMFLWFLKQSFQAITVRNHQCNCSGGTIEQKDMQITLAFMMVEFTTTEAAKTLSEKSA
jgi:hypothetical protein